MALIAMNFLPEALIAMALSLTSPQDVCRSSAASSTFRSAAESDMVWEKFLPSDYCDVLRRSGSPVEFSSKKELYFLLCNPILVDGGKRMFSLEKRSGKKCYRLCARELSITWANDPMYWTWKPMPHQSRFSEVVELRMMCWLEIHGKINTRLLSPNILYGAYLILNIADRAYGLDTLPSETSVEVVVDSGSGRSTSISRGAAYLRCPRKRFHGVLNKQSLEQLRYNDCRVIEGEEKMACDQREDGWLEIELGEFFNHGGNGEVKMSLMEVKGEHLKGGLVIEGIEVRPKLDKYPKFSPSYC